VEKTTWAGAEAVGADEPTTTPEVNSGARPSDWEQALDSLPATWPKSLRAQAADPVVRAAVRLAYEAGVPVVEIRRRTGRSLKALRLILSQEGVLGAPGGRGVRSGLPKGYPTWSAYATAVIRRRIKEGMYSAATSLPPYRVLAVDLKVPRGAVYRAARRLKGEGRLRGEGRRVVVEGTVGQPAPHRPAATVRSLVPARAHGGTGQPRAAAPADRARPSAPARPRTPVSPRPARLRNFPMDTADLAGRYRRLAPEHRRLYRVLSVLPVADTDPETAGAACSLRLQDAAAGLEVLAGEGLLRALDPGPARPQRYGWNPRIRDHARRWFREVEHPAAVNAAVLRTAEWLLRIATSMQIRLTPSQAALHSMRGLPPLAGQVPFDTADTPVAVGWLASQAPNMTCILRAANDLQWDRTWQLVSAWWPLFQLQPPPRRLWEEAHRIGLHAARRASDQAAVRQMLLAQAIGLRAAGHPDEAAAVCVQTAEQAQYYAAHRDHGQALLELGRCHHHRSRFEQAEETLATALTVWDSVPYPRGTALAHLTLADIALDRHRPDDAQQLTGTALDILRTQGTAHDTARALTLNARTHLHTGHHDEALNDLAEATTLFTHGGADRWHARTLALQGDVHRHQGRDHAARICYREAAHLSVGRWPEADHYNRQADDIGRFPTGTRPAPARPRTPARES